MGSPLSPGAIARHREGIKVGKIVDRLEKCAIDGLVLRKDELTAARLLLDRVLPVLRATELSAAPGTAGGFVIMGVPEAGDTAAWSAEHGKGDEG